ncbi:MAG: ASKHA domain-containing protein [Thermoleophilia bacterium]
MILPGGRRFAVEPGTSLLTALHRAGVEVSASCGGTGNCGTCRVRVKGGPLPPPDGEESALLGADALAQGARLACRIVTTAGASLEISPLLVGTGVGRDKAAVGALPETGGTSGGPDLVCLEVGGLETAGSDVGRFLEVLAEWRPTISRDFPLPLMNEASRSLRAHGGKCLVAADGDEVLAVLDPDGGGPLGLAVDLGTTTVAVYAVDMVSGELVAAATARNRQREFGDDVMSRLVHAPAAAGDLRRLAWESVEEAADRLGIPHLRDRLVDAVLVGNSAMHHLALGLDTHHLARAPYTPLAAGVVVARGVELHHSLPGWLRVRALPLVGHFVGSDVVAGLAASAAGAGDRATLYVDMGTNAEIVLSTRHGIWGCSAAAGPALEGARLSCGMPAGPGAVVRAVFDGLSIAVTTWDGGLARGLAGTGALSLVASLRREGALGERGLLVTERLPAGAVRDTAGGRTLTVAEGVSLTEADVSEILLARGAVVAGWRMLLQEARVAESDVERIVVAGTLGNEADPADLMALGLLPGGGGVSIEAAGNAAGAGAARALVDAELRAEVSRLAEKAVLVQLAGNEDFDRFFVDELVLP